MVPSRFRVGKDCKTAYDRRRGRPCNIPTQKFGEQAWYKEGDARPARKEGIPRAVYIKGWMMETYASQKGGPACGETDVAECWTGMEKEIGKTE